MKYLLIVDLMGTLLESTHVVLVNKQRQMLTPEGRYYFDEYKSRILYISRKINTFLQNNNRVCLVTSVDHCSEEQLLCIIKDIDKNISVHNRDKIEYFLTDYEDSDFLDKELSQEIKDRLTITSKREQAYDLAINENKGYYYITIDDDLINASCVSKVIDLGGQYIHINNMLNTGGWCSSESYERSKKHFHINDNFDRLVNYYKQCSTLFLESSNSTDFSQFFDFSEKETYLKLLSNKLDIDELYSWLIFRDIQNAFSFKYSFEYIQELIKHKCIQIYPSFNQAYQKVLIPKIMK